MSDSLRHYGLQPTRLLYPWDSPGKSTAMVCYFLSRGPSWLRNRTHSSCITGTLYHWATWEAQGMLHPSTFPNNPIRREWGRMNNWQKRRVCIFTGGVSQAGGLGSNRTPPPWVSCTGFQQLMGAVTQRELGNQSHLGLHLDPTIRNHQT